MQDALLVRGGTLVTGGGMFRADLLALDGRIEAIARSIEPPAGARILDASGKWVLPGAIDPHVHFGLRVGGAVTADDFASGTRQAARGGVTTVIDYLDPAPGDGLAAAFATRRAEMDGRLAVDAALHGVLTDWTASTAAGVAKLVAAGISSFKVFLVYAQRIDDAALARILDASAADGFLVCAHCESQPLLELALSRVAGRAAEPGMAGHRLSRPPEVEVEAVERACSYARMTGGRLHAVHLSAAGSAEAVARARAAGADVTGETCPQYLALDESLFDAPEGRYAATCPQVRRRDHDGAALARALGEGILGILATDHCAWSREQKDAWEGDFRRVPGGIPGVGTLLPLAFSLLVRSGFMPPESLARLLAEAPARRFGLPAKGRLAPGFDADLVVLDPERETVVEASTGELPGVVSPYEGMKLAGFPDATVVRGRVVFERDRPFPEPAGRFVPRTVCGRI